MKRMNREQIVVALARFGVSPEVSTQCSTAKLRKALRIAEDKPAPAIAIAHMLRDKSTDAFNATRDKVVTKVNARRELMNTVSSQATSDDIPDQRTEEQIRRDMCQPSQIDNELIKDDCCQQSKPAPDKPIEQIILEGERALSNTLNSKTRQRIDKAREFAKLVAVKAMNNNI